MLYLCQEKINLIKKKEFNNISNDLLKINKVINKYLLTGEKLISELHLKQSGFTYSACGSFAKYRERMQKFRETDSL